MGLLLELGEGVRAELLEPALGALVRQHDALRLRYRREAEGWRQWHAEEGWELRLEQRELGGRELEQVVSELQRSLELEQGPLLRPLLLAGAGGPRWVLLGSHPLVLYAVPRGGVLGEVV